MKTLVRSDRQFEFFFPQLDTQILVEESNEGVMIRATHNTFSELQKIYFIRELAAEGFIPDTYRWFSGFGGGAWLHVRWLVDYSWLKLNVAQAARTRRFMVCLLAGAASLWLGLMIAAFVH